MEPSSTGTTESSEPRSNRDWGRFEPEPFPFYWKRTRVQSPKERNENQASVLSAPHDVAMDASLAPRVLHQVRHARWSDIARPSAGWRNARRRSRGPREEGSDPHPGEADGGGPRADEETGFARRSNVDECAEREC